MGDSPLPYSAAIQDGHSGRPGVKLGGHVLSMVGPAVDRKSTKAPFPVHRLIRSNPSQGLGQVFQSAGMDATGPGLANAKLLSRFG